MNRTIMVSLFMTCILLTGCKMLNRRTVNTIPQIDSNIPESIANSETEVEKTTTIVKDSVIQQRTVNSNINTQAEKISVADQTSKFTKEVSGIKEELVKSAKIMDNLDTAGTHLGILRTNLIDSRIRVQRLEDQFNEIAKISEAQKKVIEELKNEVEKTNKQMINKILAFCVLIGMIAIGASGFLAWRAIACGGSIANAIGLTVFGIMISAFSIGYMYYSRVIGISVIGIFVGIIVMIIYKVYVESKKDKELNETLALQQETIKYNVRLTETLKRELPLKKKERIFGGIHDNGVAGTMQNNSGIKPLIDQARKEIDEEDGPTMKLTKESK